MKTSKSTASSCSDASHFSQCRPNQSNVHQSGPSSTKSSSATSSRTGRSTHSDPTPPTSTGSARSTSRSVRLPRSATTTNPPPPSTESEKPSTELPLPLPLLEVSSSRADCCLCSYSSHTCVVVATEDNESDDESYANESDDSDESDEESDDEEEEEIDDEELQGLAEDLAEEMPTTRKSLSKKGSTPKKTKSDVDELSGALASGLSLSSGLSKAWYSPNFGTFPFNMYSYRDEEFPVEHMVVEVLAPNLPIEFIRTVQVMPCGTKLKIVIGTPRWLFEETFIQRRFEGDFHAQHAGVDCFVENVIQPVRSKFKGEDRWIEGAPVIIPLTKKCVSGDVTWSRGTWRTRNMDLVEGQVQFNWVISIRLKTTKMFEIRNNNADVQNFAGLDDDDAL